MDKNNNYKRNSRPNGDKRYTNNKKSDTRKPERQDRRDKREEINDEDDYPVEMIVGRNPVIEALKAEKPIDTIYIDKEATGSISVIVKLAKERDIVTKQVSHEKLTAMSRMTNHQGVVAMGACAQYAEISDILALAKSRGEDPFVIICDEINDPHNLGAIIRTAECSGTHGIIIPKRRSASLSGTVYKTSAGAASWLPVARVPNIPAAIDELKENGVWIYGTDASGEQYDKANLTGPIGLVIGSEGEGMGRLVSEKCDFMLSLPLKGKVNSLNASVAAGIFMYEVLRQRSAK
ncbi:MAG: 23S rRNA (guanosine(2251)-2'-O)-methyltransferase RlmB [Oscillospiraceae bacterium]|nr:23S rRNA (guanosine(2251)-2'-O)-methyltransferase RlmB [Oscillospiraceae bacterium]